MDFDELKDRVGKLHSLLADPQPGIASWCIAVGQMMNNLTDRWTLVDVPGQPTL